MSCVSYRSHKRSWRELRTEFNFTSVLHELCDLEGFLTLRPSSFLGEILKCPAQPLPHFSNLFLGIYSIPGTSWRLGEMGSVRQTTKISDFIKKKKKCRLESSCLSFRLAPTLLSSVIQANLFSVEWGLLDWHLELNGEKGSW